ncbi:hypothetical protein [Lunatibacter salilacus]|uniref:hypothetical protein n=1 Tax=Lunatibacter salilacus TaxID=2483804 RepID=UPI00131AE4E4|nr:hypothetical protein [Lunatibacter salilacus]
MTKALKPIFGFAMAAMLAVQAMLLPILVADVNTAKTAFSDNLSAQITLVDEHADKSPIIFESERLIISIPKSFSEGLNFIYSTLADYFFYINQRLTTAYQLSQQVMLVFGIREIKFPTHFFW